MKKIILAASLFVSTAAFAGSPRAIQAVMEMKEVQQLGIISKVELVNTYRCPQCFDIAVYGRDSARLLVSTRGDFMSNTIKTAVIESR